MKLVHIYNVVKDEHFLVELVDDRLTLNALKTVVQDRAGLHKGQYRLVFNHREFKRRRLPNSCFHSHKSFQIFPHEVNPSARFAVFVKIKGSNSSKPLRIKGVRCSDTVQDLGSKILKTSRLRSRKLEIKKDGHKLVEEHRFLAYYGFTDKTQLEAVPSSDAVYEDKRNNVSEGFSLRGLKSHCMSGYNALKDAIHKQKSAPIHPQSQKIVTNGKQKRDRTKFADRLPNDIRNNPTAVPTKESLSMPDTTMNPRMEPLELDHCGYLLGKIARSYQKGDDPPKELIHYLFERWKAHMISSDDRIRNEIKKYKLATPASQFFFEVHPPFIKEREDSTTSKTSKFLATLWVSQEILKLLPNNPPWKPLSERINLRKLKWNDEIALRAETVENTRLILRHSRLILSHIPAHKPAKKATPPNPPTKMKSSKSKINFVHRLSRSTRERFKLSKPGHSFDKRKS